MCFTCAFSANDTLLNDFLRLYCDYSYSSAIPASSDLSALFAGARLLLRGTIFFLLRARVWLMFYFAVASVTF